MCDVPGGRFTRTFSRVEKAVPGVYVNAWSFEGDIAICKISYRFLFWVHEGSDCFVPRFALLNIVHKTFLQNYQLVFLIVAGWVDYRRDNVVKGDRTHFSKF